MTDFRTDFFKKQLPIDGTHSKLLTDMLKDDSDYTAIEAALLSIAGSLAAIADANEKGQKT